ncbi:MAG: hypothetical protein ACXVCP_15790 [Bdellovibrio sp.]
MKYVFRNDTLFNRIKLLVLFFNVSDTRMCLGRGEGEEEIANHGRSRVVKSFSQETGAIGQQAPRIGEHEPKLHSKSQVQEAHDSPTQLPFFSLLLFVIGGQRKESGGGVPLGVFASDSPRACFFSAGFVETFSFFSDCYRRFFLALRNLRRPQGEPHHHFPCAASLLLAEEKKRGIRGVGFGLWPSAFWVCFWLEVFSKAAVRFFGFLFFDDVQFLNSNFYVFNSRLKFLFFEFLFSFFNQRRLNFTLRGFCG